MGFESQRTDKSLKTLVKLPEKVKDKSSANKLAQHTETSIWKDTFSSRITETLITK